MVMEKAETRVTSGRLRWGELEEEDNEDLDFLLPPPTVIGPDENGVKKTIEYRFNDQGQKVVRTTTTRIRKVAKTRLNKRALERREWRKFGGATSEDASNRLTVVSTEEILLERPRPPGSKAEDVKSGADALSALAGTKGGAVLMVCRICGKKGDHWTSKCPYKDLAPAGTTDTLTMDKIDGAAAASSGAPTAASSAAGRSTYVPPSLRGGVDRSGDTMRRRNDENSVRVTNLSEDTRDADLHELFKPFGHITRVYVAMDQKTGVSRGFGFVNFVNREDAQRAINKLNGYGYDNFNLRVESRRLQEPETSFSLHSWEEKGDGKRQLQLWDASLMNGQMWDLNDLSFDRGSRMGNYFLHRFRVEISSSLVIMLSYSAVCSLC